MKVGIVQQSNTTDIQQNIAKSPYKVLKHAKHKEPSWLCYKNCIVVIYFCQAEETEQFNLAEPIPSDTTQIFSDAAKKNEVVLVTSLFEKRAAGLYHNTSVVFEKDGSVAGKYRKMHIPDDPAYYEKFYFTPGDLGFKPIQTSVGKLGVLVCWDQWYPEAARIMALNGAEILIYPTAIGWESTDTQAEKDRQFTAWQTVQRGHAVANGLPVVAVNRVGHEPDWTGVTNGIQFWGQSFVSGPQGEIIFSAPRYGIKCSN
jgi:N-carbamoylputrescine amidase